MIVLPIIGAITASQIGLWVAGGAVGGVVSWLVRRVLKLKEQAAALQKRVDALAKAAQ